MDAGAQGYMLKDRPAAELAECVRRVCRGLRVVDPELAAEAWAQEPDPLSERERQILWRAGEGKSGAEIAVDLHLSEGTVRNYLSEAINKLGAANRIEAARLAGLMAAKNEQMASAPAATPSANALASAKAMQRRVLSGCFRYSSACSTTART